MSADPYYTLILVPDARSASRKIRVSHRLVRWLTRATLGAAAMGAGVLLHYGWLNAQASHMDELRAQNEELSVQTQKYRETLDQLEHRIAFLGRTVTKLGVISGVEDTMPEAEGLDGGRGGVAGLHPTPPSADPDVALSLLSRSLSALAERSSRIEGFYTDQQELLAHTPSVWPVRGYLSSGYGRRNDPFTGRRSMHSGIDISASRGTRVAAPADGVVVSVGRRGAYGRSIVIDHGNDIITRYGHLDSYDVKPGQRVKRGDVIGRVGNTGRSNAPHLHYEVWVKDKAQNPIHYILDEYRTFG